MRVWLVACVIAVLVAGVAAAVVVLPGGEGEEAVEGEAVSAVVEAEAEVEQAEPEVETSPEPVTFRYNLLDIAGGATAAGSYAFLETAGDSTSAVAHFDYGYSRTVELRIHPTDASGTSRAAFYDTVQVGDSFDYQTEGRDCGFRFKITSVAPAATPRTFGIEYVHSYGGRCSTIVDDPSQSRDVQFAWKVPAGVPGLNGVRELLHGEPAGPGTYRFDETVPCEIDVPAGSVIFYGGIIEHGPDPAGSDAAVATVLIENAEMTSGLHIDPDTCEEEFRVTSSPYWDALFDQIMASIRRVDGVGAGAAQAAVAPPAEPVTLRYDRLDISGGATAPGSYAFLKTAGDATSAVDNFGNRSAWGVELRIHPTDATGASRAAFFDTVQVGDSFDYQTNRLACGYRFRVTRVAATATPRVFGVEYSTRYGGRCSTTVDDPTAARAVRFVWGVRPGIDGPGGVREMLYGAPTGPGTYRLDIGSPYVFDVPPGMKIIHDGLWHLEPSADAPSGAPSSVISLIDAATGSVLTIDPDTGKEVRRVIKSPEVNALFDQIMASIRRG